MGDVRIFDSTLRDGCQGAEISLSFKDKLDVARRLDAFGVDYIEADAHDSPFFESLRKAPFAHARAVAFARADDDAGVRALVDTGAPTVAVLAPADRLDGVLDAVRSLKAAGLEVVVEAEHVFDRYCADRDAVLSSLHAAALAGADWLVLGDTNGGSLPDEVAEIVGDVVNNVETAGIGIHTRNEADLAIANALAAVDAGASMAVGTVNGYGARAGSANLCSLIPGLVLKKGHDCAAAAHLSELTALSHFVDEVAGLPGHPRMPYVGRLVSAVDGGIDGGIADGGIADGSGELQQQRAQPEATRALRPTGYSVASFKGPQDDGSRSHASAEVEVGGEILRGTAAGFGPVDALEKALRAALLPAYPELEHVTLIDFRSQIAGGGGDGRAPVRVRITATAPGAQPWTSTGVAGDLLHASWLAVADCLEYAVASGRVKVDEGALRRAAVPSVEEVALAVYGELTEDDRSTLRTIERIDWATTILDLADAADRAFAAHAVALGATLFYSFGNFCAVGAHPHHDSVRRVNIQKGRPVNQVGSVTTTRSRFETLFDWNLLPEGLTRAQVLALMDDFFDLGPIGFRGPAAPGMPAQVTSLDADVLTTQIISPGHQCPSNELLDEVLKLIGRDYLFVTSANVSSGVTGKVEPAHYDLAGIQADFHDQDGIVLIGHRDEAAVRASYPKHLPMSTSILAFHKLGQDDGAPAIVMERHGSLDIADVREIVARHGFGLVLADAALTRLPIRPTTV